MKAIKDFWRDEAGLDLPVYALTAGLIAVLVATAFTDLGARLVEAIEGLFG